MTARTRSTLDPSDGRRRGGQPDDKRPEPSAVGRLGWAASPLRLRLALLVSLAGAALTVVAVLQGLVANAPAPAFASTPLLVILAVAPTVLALGGVLVGKAPGAAGILTGAAFLAPGLALVDAQFIRDALQASRPEVLVPTSLATLTPAVGAYLLLAGHLAAIGAGVLAAGRAGADPDSDYFAALDASVTTAGRGRALGWALAAGTISVVGLLFPPFASDNAFIVADDLVASPGLVKYGGLLLVLTLLMGAVAAAVNPRPAVARGMAIGLFVALAWLVVPQLASVASVDWLRFEFWPLFALVPVGLFAAVLFITGDHTDGQEDDSKGGEVTLESSPLHVAAGVLGVLTGIAALVGGFTTLVVTDIDQPESYANRQLVPAGIVLVLLSVGLFTRWAGAVRPAFVVALGTVPLVGFAALDTAFTATTVGNLVIPGLPVADTHVGPAVWFVIVGFVLAAVAAITAGIAGGAERDDVDLTRRTLHSRYAIPAGGAVLFAIGAFTSPMIKATGYIAAGVWTEFRLASWGLLIGLAVVAAAAGIAALARPVRAAALLLGAAIVVGVRLLELPMTGDRVAGAQAGAGTWLSLACLVALVVAAVAAMTDPNKEPEPEPEQGTE